MSAESEYLKALLPALNEIEGVFCWRQQAGKVPVGRGWMQLAPKGASDIVGIVRNRIMGASSPLDDVTVGRFLSVEAKATKTGKAKDNGQGALDAQRKWAAMVRMAGGIHIDACKRDDESMADAVARVVAEVRRYAS